MKKSLFKLALLLLATIAFWQVNAQPYYNMPAGVKMYSGGKGIKGAPSETYNLPVGGALNGVLVECSCKQVESHGDSTCPSSVNIDGVNVSRTFIYSDPDHLGDYHNHYIYRRWIPGSGAGSSISYSTSSGAGSMRGMAVFTFRDDPANQNYPHGKKVDFGFYQSGRRDYDVALENCGRSRTVDAHIMIHEHDDNDVGDYWFGGNHYAFNSPNTLGSELSKLMLYKGVSSSASSVQLGIQSDPARGFGAESFMVGSIFVTTDECCPDFNPSAISVPPQCYDSEDGSITVNATCPSNNCEYKISGSSWQSSNVFTGVGRGTYTIQVRIAGGTCVTSGPSIHVFAPSLLITKPIVNANVTCVGFCNGEASVSAAGGTPPYNFVWSTGDSAEVVTGLCAGDYIVSVTDYATCLSTVSITITEPEPLTVEVEIDSISCYGECDASVNTVITGGTPPFIYTWSNGEVTSSVDNLCAGEYHVIVSDANSCLVALCFTVTEPDTLIVSAIENNGVSCYGFSDGSATADATGGSPPYNYLWDNNETTATASNLLGGDHTVSVTDRNGCLATAMVNIYEPTEIIPTVSQNSSVSCFGESDGSAAVEVTGGVPPYTYIWDNNETTAIATNLNVGIHTVTVTDQDGCFATTTIDIFEPTAIVVTATENNGVSCFGLEDGSATASASGGTPPYAFLWDNNETTQIAVSLTGGNHTVTATDMNGCTETAIVNIYEPALLVLSAIIDNGTSCNGHSGTSATANLSGGTPPYIYQWDNGETTQTITGLFPGSYQVEVVDANGCTAMDSLVIEDIVPLEVIDIIVVDQSCSDVCDGGVEVVIVGGTPPYSYEWDNGMTSSTATDLCAGLHHVTITDANGCVLAGACGLVKKPEAIEIDVEILVDSLCIGLCGGEAALTVTNGILPLTYTWSDGGTGDSRNDLCGGIYSITITDANGCEEIASLEIGNSDCEVRCVEERINFNNFDSNWGVWNDGGSDCRRSPNDALYSSGGVGRCIRLRDNTVTSTTTTANLDLSGYKEITVSFTYIVSSFEGSEDFWLQISTDGGANFTTVEDWINDVDFVNEVREDGSVSIDGPFSTDTQLRFRADASNNSDFVYLDNVNIDGCKSTVVVPSSSVIDPASNPKNSSSNEALQSIDFKTDLMLYPNPTAENFTVSFNLATAANVQLSVVSITGRVIETHEMGTLEGKHIVDFDGSQYVPGYYLVILQTEEGLFSRKLLIGR